jgi:hypothetical protein
MALGGQRLFISLCARPPARHCAPSLYHKPHHPRHCRSNDQRPIKSALLTNADADTHSIDAVIRLAPRVRSRAVTGSQAAGTEHLFPGYHNSNAGMQDTGRLLRTGPVRLSAFVSKRSRTVRDARLSLFVGHLRAICLDGEGSVVRPRGSRGRSRTRQRRCAPQTAYRVRQSVSEGEVSRVLK